MVSHILSKETDTKIGTTVAVAYASIATAAVAIVVELGLSLFLPWLVVLIWSLPSNAADMLCIRGELKLIQDPKSMEKNVEYCYDTSRTILVSKSCLQFNCSAFAFQGKYSFREISSSVGNPGFALCRRLHGRPELLQFFADNRFYSLDRCVFNKTDFVDTGLLLSHYLAR
jgi:hypothetical protein